MLKKQDITIGTKLRFNSQLKKIGFGLVTKGSYEVSKIGGYAEPGGFFDGASLIIQPNDEVEVSKPLKRRDGVNCIGLKKDEKEGYFYWIEVYHNAKIITD